MACLKDRLAQQLSAAKVVSNIVKVMSGFCSTTFSNNFFLKMYLEVELQMDIQLMQVQVAFPGDHCVEEWHCLGGRRKSISALFLTKLLSAQQEGGCWNWWSYKSGDSQAFFNMATLFAFVLLSMEKRQTEMLVLIAVISLWKISNNIRPTLPKRALTLTGTVYQLSQNGEYSKKL